MVKCPSCGYAGNEKDDPSCGLCSSPLRASARDASSQPSPAHDWTRVRPDEFLAYGPWLQLLRLSVVALGVGFLLQALLLPFMAHDPGSDPSHTFARVPRAVSLLITCTGCGLLVAVFVAPLSWLAWTYRATANARALAVGLTFTPAVAVVAQLVPLLGQAVAWAQLLEVVRASDPAAAPDAWRGRTARGEALVHGYSAAGLVTTLTMLVGVLPVAAPHALALAVVQALSIAAAAFLGRALVEVVVASQGSRYERVRFELECAEAAASAATPQDPPPPRPAEVERSEAEPEPPPGVVRLHVSRCPYCHDDVARRESVVCQDCLARHHGACWDAAAACSGCGGAHRMEVTRGSEQRTGGSTAPVDSGRLARSPSGRLIGPPAERRPGAAVPADSLDEGTYCAACGRRRAVSSLGRCTICGAVLAPRTARAAPAWSLGAYVPFLLIGLGAAVLLLTSHVIARAAGVNLLVAGLSILVKRRWLNP